MSDNTQVVEAEAKPKKPVVRKDLGDGRFLERKDFGGGLEGFSYYTVQFKTWESAVAHFTREQAGKTSDGVDISLSYLNSAVASAMRAKAQNKIPEDKDARNSQLQRGDNLVITEEDAQAYMPGERDITSLSGLQKLVTEKKKQFAEAKAQGDSATMEALKAEILDLSKKIEQMIMADL